MEWEGKSERSRKRPRGAPAIEKTGRRAGKMKDRWKNLKHGAVAK